MVSGVGSQPTSRWLPEVGNFSFRRTRCTQAIVVLAVHGGKKFTEGKAAHFSLTMSAESALLNQLSRKVMTEVKRRTAHPTGQSTNCVLHTPRTLEAEDG